MRAVRDAHRDKCLLRRYAAGLLVVARWEREREDEDNCLESV